MELWPLVYNLAVGAAALATAIAVHRQPDRTVRNIVAVAATASWAIGLGLVLGIGGYHSSFGAMWLWSWGLFGHAVALAAALAVLLWPRQRLPAGLLGLVAVGLAAIGVDAFLVEPRWLEITHVRIDSDRVSAPMRIVVVADLQTDHVGDYERDALERAMAQAPDLLLFPGDYLQLRDDARYAVERERLRALLRDLDLQPALGAYAVGGNMESRASWPDLFDELPIEPIVHTRSITTGPVVVTGLSFDDSFDTALSVPRRDDRFHVVFGHGPNFALGSVDADLLVAGHTHGGQVRLPFLGPVLTLSAVPRGWAAGHTTLDGGRHLIVSRGVGMERAHAPRIRFLCRPEIVVIDIVPRP